MLLASAALALPTNTLALPTRTSALSTSATNSSRGCPVRASTTVLIYNETPHLEAHEGIGGVAITSAQRAANYELRRAFIAPHLRG